MYAARCTRARTPFNPGLVRRGTDLNAAAFWGCHIILHRRWPAEAPHNVAVVSAAVMRRPQASARGNAASTVCGCGDRSSCCLTQPVPAHARLKLAVAGMLCFVLLLLAQMVWPVLMLDFPLSAARDALVLAAQAGGPSKPVAIGGARTAPALEAPPRGVTVVDEVTAAHLQALRLSMATLLGQRNHVLQAATDVVAARSTATVNEHAVTGVAATASAAAAAAAAAAGAIAGAAGAAVAGTVDDSSSVSGSKLRGGVVPERQPDRSPTAASGGFGDAHHQATRNSSSSVASSAGATTASAGLRRRPPPHVLFVVADDLGHDDLSTTQPLVHTPVLHALAAGGMYLQNYYSQSLCSPSRAALNTGRYPARFGMQTYVLLDEQAYGMDLDELTLPQRLQVWQADDSCRMNALHQLGLVVVVGWRPRLADACIPERDAVTRLTTRAQTPVLRQRSSCCPSSGCDGVTRLLAGWPPQQEEYHYRTHLLGKWHLGYHSWRHTPLFRGYHSFNGYYSGQGTYTTHMASQYYDYHIDTDVDRTASGVRGVTLLRHARTDARARLGWSLSCGGEHAAGELCGDHSHWIGS